MDFGKSPPKIRKMAPGAFLHGRPAVSGGAPCKGFCAFNLWPCGVHFIETRNSASRSFEEGWPPRMCWLCVWRWLIWLEVCSKTKSSADGTIATVLYYMRSRWKMASWISLLMQVRHEVACRSGTASVAQHVDGSGARDPANLKTYRWLGSQA